jgi:hypothetical protein
MCTKNLTEIVDHIVPSGIAVLQAQASGHYKLDKYAGFFFRSNLQGLCRSCHAIKSLADIQTLGTRLSYVGTDRRNTTVVCGPPASGKSTYVQQHLEDGDVYWDYDEVMAELSGLPMHQEDATKRTAVLLRRDRFIQETAEHQGRVYFIITRSTTKLARLLVSAGASLVEMDTTAGTRVVRLSQRDTMENGSEWPDVVAKQETQLRRFTF